ncbi:MAG: hypothetical protein RLZZ385_1574 [Pseudomonadota bacterium]|jgi:hypothetical protein
MNANIKAILEKLEKLEDELRAELKNQEQNLHYHLEGTRVLFDQKVREAHARLRTGLIPWFRTASWRNILSAPFIYGMIVPLAILDLSLSIYQAICFRLYEIPRVRRSRYIVIDRHYLSYLNGIEKLNCIYCGYGNGVIAYGREIISRTEQYWCPIKHARDYPGAHRRYGSFLPYGDAEDYREEVLKFREQLRQEKD